MKNFQIKTKLLLLSGFFIIIILITNLYSEYLISTLNDHFDNVSKIQLPAVRKMTLVDMYHDGFVGIVYKSVYAAELKNKELLQDSQEKFDENSKKMKQLVNDISLIPLSDNIKKASAEAQPAIDDYLKITKEIVDLSSSGQVLEATQKLPEFDKYFSLLENKLGNLSDLIMAESAESIISSEKSESAGKKISLAITVFALLIGILTTWLFVKNLIGSLTMTVEELSVSIHGVQNTSQIVNMVGKRLAECVDTQASSITESATAMEEISSMIQNNNKSAQRALELSSLTKNAADSGKNTVNQMQEEMRIIAQSYDEIQSSIVQNKVSISKIVEVINQIADKTKVINDIVFQTKLLSFNASVEAARAGESGKGFAVVAEEVGNLAEMSGKASTEIALMLSESQIQVKSIAESTTRDISNIVEKGKIQIENGNTISARCFGDLEQIQSCATSLDITISEISNAIHEQSIGVGEVNLSLKQLDTVTQETSEMSEKSKTASKNLKNQSHELRVSVQSLRKILGAKKSYDAVPVSET